MAYDILFNKEVFHFTENGLPCLVHYKNKTGGSHFTVTLVADLFLQGSKILFLTAYPMAKDNFLEQVKGKEKDIIFIEEISDLKNSENHQAIILKSGDEKLYLDAIKVIPDINERIVLVKNFEIFTEETIEKTLQMKKIILSGDIDKSPSKKQISDKLYQTTISFSQPDTAVDFKTPILEKYTGYLKTTDKEGFVQIKM